MEDVLQFLVIAGVIAFGIFRQVNKDKEKKSEQQAPMPVPQYEEFENEEPVVFEIPQKQAPPLKPQKPLPQEGVRTTYTSPSPPPTPVTNLQEEIEENESEFAIRSQEEARRAIIWSEILQRKY